jgi:polyisoprenyl-phosphate glycosyltransferase
MVAAAPEPDHVLASMMNPRPRLCVVVPARNERLNIRFFYDRARAALEELSELEWNLVFVNNDSEDGTLEAMQELHAVDDRVKIITLSRNFGYHSALMAGLSSVEGDYYAIIDVDCEDPPELLVELYRAMQGGAQLAYGVRSKRDEPRLVTFGRKLFYLANRSVADSEIVMWMGEFSVMTRQVRDALLIPQTSFISVRAEMGYAGFPRVGIPYFRERRTHGESHYNLPRMAVYAILSILSGTTFPLRLVSYIAAFVGLAYPAVVFGMHLTPVAAASLAAIVSLYFLAATVPLISLYLARVYKNGVGRPLFLIDKSRTSL